MTVLKMVFVRISILIILNVFLQSSFVYSAIQKTSKFSDDLELKPIKVLDRVPQKADWKDTPKIELKSEVGNVNNQTVDDLNEMCQIAAKQAGYVIQEQATNTQEAEAEPEDTSSAAEEREISLTPSSEPNPPPTKEKGYAEKHIKDSWFYKKLYFCGQISPTSDNNKGKAVDEVTDLYIAPSDSSAGKAIVYIKSGENEVELIGSVRGARFPIKGKPSSTSSSSRSGCCF